MMHGWGNPGIDLDTGAIHLAPDAEQAYIVLDEPATTFRANQFT